LIRPASQASKSLRLFYECLSFNDQRLVLKPLHPIRPFIEPTPLHERVVIGNS
jgi:hypothetical protein